MKRKIAALVVGAAVAILTGGTPAWSAESASPSPETNYYVTVAWQMPSWSLVDGVAKPTWPQAYWNMSEPYPETACPAPHGDELCTPPGGNDPQIPLIQVFDRMLDSCSQYQIDVYKYTTKWQREQVHRIIANKGGLLGPNNPYREPLVQAKLIKVGGCESPSPSPSESSPSPSPSESSPSPTPTESSPSPTPDESCTHEDGLEDGCLPGTGPEDVTPGLLKAGLGMTAAALAIFTLLGATRRRGAHE